MSVHLPELEVMQQIADIAEGLSPAELRRVATWFREYSRQAASALREEVAEAPAVVEEAAFAPEAPEEEAAPAPTYDTFDELFEAVAPKTGAQKVAVAGYWLETREGRQPWKASEANKLLKQIGVRVSSVSIVLTNAVKARDPLVEQVARLGDGERSRKTFCLSQDGVSFVEDRLGR